MRDLVFLYVLKCRTSKDSEFLNYVVSFTDSIGILT